MRNSQLTFARQYRGMNQSNLAKQIPGLSQSNLSKYEKGIGTLSDDVLFRIMDTLNFPIGFLDLKIKNNVEYRHYRKKASIGSMDRDKIDRFISVVAYCFDWMSDFIELPSFQFKYIDLERGATPEEVALIVRRQFKLGVAPIENICNFLERNGIFVYFWDCEYEDFDGVSLITDKGNHLIIVNRNQPNDRIRFSLAHELGHSLMHLCCDIVVLEVRDTEKEAHKFAAEFLMPSQGIKGSLLNVKFSQLPILKSYWLTSMASIMYRAKALQQINDVKYIQLRNELSRRSWLKKEPYDVFIDEPSVISKSYDLITTALGYSINDIAKSLLLPIDIIEEVFRINRKIFTLKRVV